MAGAPRARDATTGPIAAGGTAWRSKRPPRKPSPATRLVVGGETGGARKRTAASSATADGNWHSQSREEEATETERTCAPGTGPVTC
jgi:hypothetical protein